MRRGIVWIALLGAVGALTWWFLRPGALAVDVASVTRGTARATTLEQGKTRVIDRYVVSASVAGRLLRTSLEEGDRVEARQLIGEIDPLPLRSRVEEIEAQIRAIERRIDGVGTKKPKPEEIERARVLEQTAKETMQLAEKELAEFEAAHRQANADLERLVPLARDQRVAPSELDAARAAEEQARQRVLAQEDRIRIRKLAISVAHLERAVLEARLSDYDWEERVYREQVVGQKAALRSITADLKRTQIHAPVGGTILAIYKQSEQVVQAGTPLFDLADLDALEIEAEFLSEDAAHMREGMAVEVSGRALGERVVVGQLKQIEPSAFTKISSLGVEQQRVRVIVGFDARGTGLGDGFRVQVRVILEERPATLLVPEGALFRDRDGWSVFRVQDGRSARVRVKTGIRDGRMREVIEGLQENDEVVLYPADALEDGRRVERLPPGGGA